MKQKIRSGALGQRCGALDYEEKRKMAKQDDQAKAAAKEHRTERDIEPMEMTSAGDRDDVYISQSSRGRGFGGKAVTNPGKLSRQADTEMYV